MSNETTKTDWIHPFERAGFGHAPYRVTGYGVSKFQACPGAPVQCGTSCDVCATGIMNVYQITSAEGVTFKVGCDCVQKTGDTSLRHGMRAARREFVSREYYAKIRAERAEREAKKEAARRAAAVEYAFGIELLFTLVVHAKNDWDRLLFMRMGRELADGEIPVLDGWKKSDKHPDKEAPAFWAAVNALEAPASTYLGEVGKRVRGLRATFLHEAYFDGMYGRTYIANMVTDQGNVLVWKSSSGLPPEVRKPGAVLELTATIKAHTEYKGVKQTMLARCKVA